MSEARETRGGFVVITMIYAALKERVDSVREEEGFIFSCSADEIRLPSSSFLLRRPLSAVVFNLLPQDSLLLTTRVRQIHPEKGSTHACL